MSVTGFLQSLNLSWLFDLIRPVTGFIRTKIAPALPFSEDINLLIISMILAYLFTNRSVSEKMLYLIMLAVVFLLLKFA